MALAACATTSLPAQGRQLTAHAGVVATGRTDRQGRVQSGMRAGVAVETHRCFGHPIEFGLAVLRLKTDTNGPLLSPIVLEPSFRLRISPAPRSWPVRPYLAFGGQVLLSNVGFLGGGIAGGMTHLSGAHLELSHDRFNHEGSRARWTQIRAGWSWRYGSAPRETCR